jgi:hypothetical protein
MVGEEEITAIKRLFTLPTLLVYNAGMTSLRQYTIRNIPSQVDKFLRQKAKAVGKSLNETLLDALKRGAGLSDEVILHHDLDFVIGTWTDDPTFDEITKLQRKVDKGLWK